MKQQILYSLKIVLAVILVLCSILFSVLFLVYLFTEFEIDDPANYELIPVLFVILVSIYAVVYHVKTFYLVSKVPRGETFQFKNVKKIYWYSPWIFAGLIWFALLMIVVDEFSIGFSFDFIDWLILGILGTIATLSMIEVWSLKKIYKQKGIDYTYILDQIGQE